MFILRCKKKKIASTALLPQFLLTVYKFFILNFLFNYLFFDENATSIFGFVRPLFGAVEGAMGSGGGFAPPPRRVIATFNAKTLINNFIVINEDAKRKKIVIGAVNHIYSLQFGDRLVQLQDHRTGPVVDSALCNAELSSCVGAGRDAVTETDNVNKILHHVRAAGDSSTVLICGSTRQGTCELRDADDLEHRQRGSALENIAVAANAPNASTVSLLDADGDRLYVAATHTLDSPYRDAFPAVATRLLSANLAPINSGSIDGEAAVFIRAEYRTRYRVHYVGTFADDRYVYFASVQRKQIPTAQQFGGGAGASPTLDNPLVSRLIRVCLDDDKYTSYSEIEIQCRSAADNANYNILQSMVLFRENLLGIFTDADAKNSAICVFDMAKIRLTFWYNIDRCRSGTDSIRLAHVGRDSKCINKSHLPLAEDTCQLGVGGTIEASQVAAMQLTHRRLTAIDARRVEDRLLVIVGTSRGEILQLEMKGGHSSRRLDKYADYAIGTDAVQRLQFVDDQRFLAAAGKELSLINVASCGGGGDDSTEDASHNSPLKPFSAGGGWLASCERCVTRQRDPLCGWCVESARCTRRARCATETLKHCPHVAVDEEETLTPRNASLAGSDGRRVFVAVHDLPQPRDAKTSYECVFGAASTSINHWRSSANWSRDGLTCALPSHQRQLSSWASDVSSSPFPTDSVNVPLSIRMPLSSSSSQNGASIFTVNFTFYNCAVFSVCSACTTSRWACRWCASEGKCMSAEERCLDSIGSTKCAKIDATPLAEMLVPDSNHSALVFNVLNLDESISSGKNASTSTLYCNIFPTSLEDYGIAGSSMWERRQRVRAPARLIAASGGGGRVECASAFFNYPEALPTRNFTLELANGRDRIDTALVTVYKCAEMATDCSRCLALDPKWRCSWCGGHCIAQQEQPGCAGDGSINGTGNNYGGGAALGADGLCTQPIIESFFPESGPLEGGTRIEIRGRDLGSRLSDIQNRVYVAGSRCRVVDYEISTKIVCIVDRGSGAGSIRVTIGAAGRRNVESSAVFRFRDPQPLSIYPVFGPVSGGTLLSIYGDGLTIGSRVTVHLDNLPCRVVRVDELNVSDVSDTDDRITCETAPSRQQPYAVTAIRVQIDGAVRLLRVKFDYRADPVVYAVEPAVAFESGGRILTVKGENFDSILTAKMFLLADSSGSSVAGEDAEEVELVSSLADCQILNVTQMQCASPRLQFLPPASADVAAASASASSSSFGRWPIGFRMDGVAAVRNLAPLGIHLTTVPDPQLFAFKGVKVQPADQPLIIEGNYLNQAAAAHDYLVTIGTVRCPVYLLDANQMLCRPPGTDAEPPAATDDAGVELGQWPLVVVRVGAIRAELGPIELEGAIGAGVLVGLRRAFTRWGVMRTTLAAAAVGTALLTAALIALALWRRFNNEHERVYRRIRMQIEQLESNVRNECKQAFAELQTDMMTDLTTAASIDDGGGIPFQSRAEFVQRLLFRDSPSMLCATTAGGAEQPSMVNIYGGSVIYSSQSSSIALAQFDALLWNRQFVHLFVRSIDADASVGCAERSQLASSIFAALASRNMLYCTDVILSLLSAHIEQCVMNKSGHLLFRRSDSLVEKLFQQWITVCLFQYLVNGDSGAAAATNSNNNNNNNSQTLMSNKNHNGSPILSALSQQPGGFSGWNTVGRDFFLLYCALKYQTERGAVDVVTGNARYSLSERKLLRDAVNANVVTVLVIPLDGFDQAPVVCKVLDCDTISQVKSKLLDVLFRNQPFSTRTLTVDQFDLEWTSPRHGVQLLLDDDRPQLRGRKRLNTVGYYQLPQSCLLTMQSRSAAHHSLTFRSGSGDTNTTTCSMWSSTQLISNAGHNSSATAPHSNGSPTSLVGNGTLSANTCYYHLSPNATTTLSNACTMMTRGQHRLHRYPRALTTERKSKRKHRNGSGKGGGRKTMMPRIMTGIRAGNNNYEDIYTAGGSTTSGSGYYGECFSMSSNDGSGDASEMQPSTTSINIPEVFLTRLLMCKGTIQNYLEAFFDSVMFANDVALEEAAGGSVCGIPQPTDQMPVVMRFLLDFLDDEAAANNVIDTDMLHAWKTNAIVLRFWMHLIHNPDYVLDVQRQSAVDASMVVIGQTLMDAFGRADLALSKESPSSKLLFAKEIARYRPIAAQMFRRRRTTPDPTIIHKQFYEYVESLSPQMHESLNHLTAVNELLNWVKANGVGLCDHLDRDHLAVTQRLGERLRQVINCSIGEPPVMSDQHIYDTLQ